MPVTLCFMISLLIFVELGLVDHGTGTGISFSAFYVIPIAILAWNADKRTFINFVFIISFYRAAIIYFDSTYNYSNITYYFINLVLSYILYASIGFIILKYREIYDLEKNNARIDHITGISNWQGFSETIEKINDKCKVQNKPISVVYIDCDNFKWVNDNLGHSFGDHALRIVARTIKDNIRKIDIVARLGGDEFALILTYTTPEEAMNVVKKINAILLKKMKENNYPITFSIGLATFLTPQSSYNEMLKSADNLMYEIKKSSKNNIKQQVFSLKAA